MPEIIVTAAARQDEQPVLLRERITARYLESDHFAAQLVERVGWAVLDADEIEDRSEASEPPEQRIGR